jgi:hypothetical protein
MAPRGGTRRLSATVGLGIGRYLAARPWKGGTTAMRRLLVVLLAGSGALAWLRRGLLKSLAFRSFIAALPDPAKSCGIKMIIPVDRGGRTRVTLYAALSSSL